jgi:copper/silver efflux system protein
MTMKIVKTRLKKTLIALALFAIFILIYFQFRSVSTTLLIFTGVFVAWSGGFLLMWLYGQPWFMDFPVFGVEMRELFQVQVVNLSVAVWVGFLALFGIATDDGVVMGTYLTQLFRENPPASRAEIRELVVMAGGMRVRACLMTTATTILALLPVLTSTGRGSDIMVPMAIPAFGGMLIAVITMLVVPVLYAFVRELSLDES